MRWAISVVIFGPLFIGVVSMFYVVPSVIAIAGVGGRPASEWKKPWHRTLWVLVLCFTAPGAIMLVPQTVAVVYAMAVPRKVRSQVAVAGARAARHRAYSALALAFVVFGPLWVSTLGFENSDELMISGVATATALLFVCVLSVACGLRPKYLPLRVAVIAIALVSAAIAGWATREAQFDSCHGSCYRFSKESTWFVPAYAAAGAVVAAIATRPRPTPTSG